MCDEWMPILRLPLTWEQFCQLPRNAAYKYEFLQGKVLLSPYCRYYHARLDLPTHAGVPALQPVAEIRLRPVVPADFADLVPVFAAAFQRIQPFGGLDDLTREQASHSCLERTRTGGDGPWIEEASFVALDANDKLAGAVFITLLPKGDPCEPDSYYWSEPPPADAVQQRQGQPHLTWIFTTPLAVGQGLGAGLLAGAVRALLQLGFTHLLSTFLLGNESSMLWHWRNGFELLSYPGSLRRMRQRWQAKQP